MMFERAIIVFLADIVSFGDDGDMKFHPQLPGFMRDLSAIRGLIIIMIEDQTPTQEDLHSKLKKARFPDLIYFYLGDNQKVWDLRRRYDLDFKKCVLLGKQNREDFAREFDMKFQELDQKIMI